MACIPRWLCSPSVDLVDRLAAVLLDNTCIWICMAHPTQKTLVAKPDMKTPADFSRESFTELVVNVHSSCSVVLEEVACFLEPHANGQPHLDALVRSLRQYRWKSVAEAHASAFHSEQLPVKCCKYCIIYNTSCTLV